MTPTPTADVSAEQRESEAEFVEYWVNARKINCYTSDPKIFYRLLDLAQETIARRATAPAPQRQDGYRAGMGGRNAEQND